MQSKATDKVARYEAWIGGFASVLGVVMFASLAEILVSNWQGNSDIFFQPFATACNGMVWCVYAFGRRDWFLLVPNVIAIGLGTATAVVALI